MRVSQSGNSPVQSADVSKVKVSRSADAKKSDKASEAPATASSVSSDSVNTDISAKGKEFAKAKAVAAEAPDVREDKIAALKARIAQGKYNVDAEALADRMVDDHMKMNIG